MGEFVTKIINKGSIIFLLSLISDYLTEGRVANLHVTVASLIIIVLIP